MYAMVAGTLAIIYLLPCVTKKRAIPLIAIIITIVAIFTGVDIRRVGDIGELPVLCRSSTSPTLILS